MLTIGGGELLTISDKKGLHGVYPEGEGQGLRKGAGGRSLHLFQPLRFLFEGTGMDVTRGKPDPQVFLIAAERLNTVPAARASRNESFISARPARWSTAAIHTCCGIRSGW